MLRYLYISILIVASISWAQVSSAEELFTLLDGGKAQAIIVLQDNAPPELEDSTKDLSRILEVMSGAAFPIIKESAYKGERAIFIGTVSQSTELFEILPLDEEAILITVQNGQLFLLGRTPAASSHAIYTFLENYGHCHWYQPGPLGEYIPKRDEWSLKPFTYTHTPSYLSRELIGLNSEEALLWAKRNRLRPRFNYHHNLHTIFTPEVFETHPEYFSSVQGRAAAPTGDERGPQPNLASPEAAAFAGRAAITFFEEHPDALSFSLGMNDSLLIDDTPPTRALTEPIRFFRNRPDYADLIFTFMNRAAETLATSFPNKYLGCLAYFYAENVPSFPVSPKVIPYITADRSQYYDADYRLEDEALTARWQSAGPEITALYDYYYGAPYAIPRIFTRYIEASLQKAHAHGARGFAAELYPLWPFDTPKAWLTARLLWDSSLKRKDLLEELYNNHFERAAAPISAFFTICEEAWIQQAPPGWWLKYYKDPDQTALFSPAMMTSLRGYLDQALELANSETVRARIEPISELFQLTESLYACNLAEQTLEALHHNAAEISAPVERYLKARSTLLSTLEALEAGPLKESSPNYWSYLSSGNPLPSLFDRLSAQPALQSPALVSAIEQHGLAEDKIAFALFRDRKPLQQNLLKNPSFEDIHFTSNGLRLSSWSLSTWPAPMLHIGPSEDAHRSGSYGLIIEGANKAILTQAMSAEPGKTYLFSIHLRGTRSESGSAQAFITWKDASGNILGRTDIAPMPKSQPVWAPFTTLGTAPEDAHTGLCTLIVAHQNDDNFLHIDDARALELR